ncbi:aldose 1-epimerase [Shouchella clausii]|uniref:aldose 1-epimerase family protein n=1 Tax=Shouchella tritolerans TaxID=2979466 RepID=UPI001B09F1D3|nr:aldose 1-epimerase family protein [Shouchella tritolerans]GIN14172.1 aldose 1-epimerase [Shouchella clausii]
MIIIENDKFTVEIANKGAEIRSIWHKERNRQVMWSGDPTYWGRIAPVLFPIVGRLNDGAYTYNGKSYQLSQHGFLRDQMFVTDRLQSDKAVFRFESSGQFADVYPFEFTVYLSYQLNGHTLTVGWEVVNDNEEEMYFSIGGHPAFAVPFRSEESFTEYELSFKAAEGKQIKRYELSNGLVQKPETVPVLKNIGLTDSLFQHDALVYSHLDEVALYPKQRPEEKIVVSFPGFPYVGIWSAYNPEEKTSAPFVCIEPWFGVADTVDTTGRFAEKKGIQQIGANESFKASYAITIY